MRRRQDIQRLTDFELDEIKEDLLAHGLVSVPTKPSPAMIIAGAEISGLSPARILRIYQAVLAAADADGTLPSDVFNDRDR